MSVATVYGTTLFSAAVLGPLRDRVGQILAQHAIERLAVFRPIEAAQQVVQRPVLEHHHDHMIQRIFPALISYPKPPDPRTERLCWSQRPPRIERRLSWLATGESMQLAP
jgi:hypothetical protein